MKKLGIVFISHKFYPDVGGIEVNSEILAAQFSRAGHNVVLVTWSSSAEEKDFEFKVVRNPSIPSLLKLHFDADVVFENNPCLRLSWPKILFGKPSVIALRTWVARMDGSVSFRDRIKLWWLSKASALIAVSEAVRLKSAPLATVIGNPYRNDLFYERNYFRQEYSFIFLGRLVPDKGAHLAIEAFAMLRDKLPLEDRSKLILTIIGFGPEETKLLDLVKMLNISESVNFTGQLIGETLVNELNRHRYILVPSLRWEAFGNVVLEGLACGCLPVVSTTGGLPDAAGAAGLTFDPGEPMGLYRAIEYLLRSPQLEIDLRSKAAHHLLNHTPEKIAERYLAVILESVKNKV